jgi:shikimate kinase
MTGLPGVGKSTFGKAYAQMSRTEFVELDTYVEKLAGKSVSEIFQQDGEQAFRELEAQCLERLLRRQRCTIALGGGTLTSPRSMALARELGCIVFLSAPVEIIAERLWPQKDSRPLLADCETKEQIVERLKKLFEDRHTSYEAADLILETTHSSVDTLKVELGWLERNVLNTETKLGLENENAVASVQAQSRQIPLADPNYRSPREQKPGRDSGEKIERLLKAQRHKERSEKRERSDKKDRRPAGTPPPQSGGDQRPRNEAQGGGGPRPRNEVQGGEQRSRNEAQSGSGPRPRNEVQGAGEQRPRNEAQGGGGPRPRNEAQGGGGPRPRNEAQGGGGPRPRNEAQGGGGPRPRNEAQGGSGPRPRDEAQGGGGPRPRNEAQGGGGPRPRNEAQGSGPRPRNESKSVVSEGGANSSSDESGTATRD